MVGLKTREDVAAVAGAVRLPLVLGGVSPELSDRGWLAEHGVRVALQGHQPFAAAVNAVYRTLKALREGTPPGELEGVAPPDLMRRVTRDADYRGWMEEFLA